jgi:hypothetical protein
LASLETDLNSKDVRDIYPILIFSSISSLFFPIKAGLPLKRENINIPQFHMSLAVVRV